MEGLSSRWPTAISLPPATFRNRLNQILTWVALHIVNTNPTIAMLFTTLTALALAATGLAQVAAPAGYRKVYITSKQDVKFVIVPKTRTNGSTLVV